MKEEEIQYTRILTLTDVDLDELAHRMAEILRAPARRQRNCKHCLRPFIPVNARQKFCCPDHAHAAAQAAYRKRAK